MRGSTACKYWLELTLERYTVLSAMYIGLSETKSIGTIKAFLVLPSMHHYISLLEFCAAISSGLCGFL